MTFFKKIRDNNVRFELNLLEFAIWLGAYFVFWAFFNVIFIIFDFPVSTPGIYPILWAFALSIDKWHLAKKDGS
jgi:hypothetical protein